jgi:hypothetical protein
MSVRRTALIIAIFAIIACGAGSVQADAATTARGQTVASAPVLYGKHCVTVRSSVPGRTGTICAILARVSWEERGEVTFTANSGLLGAVSVKTLTLSVNNHIVKVSHNARNTVIAVGAVIPLSWWDEPTTPVRQVKQVGVYEACMTWRGGGQACTGPHWLYSQPVRV